MIASMHLPSHDDVLDYEAFMSMAEPEWRQLVAALVGGTRTLTAPEQEAFVLASADRYPRPPDA